MASQSKMRVSASFRGVLMPNCFRELLRESSQLPWPCVGGDLYNLFKVLFRGSYDYAAYFVIEQVVNSLH